MSKIQINDVQLDGAEQFNDSETFLNELNFGEMEQIFGGMRVAEPVFAPEGPFDPAEPNHPVEPIHPYPIEPNCWYYKKPIKDGKPYPIEIFYNPCPVIL
jgi:hypothetical protein